MVAGLCEGGNEPAGSLKAIFVMDLIKTEPEFDPLLIQSINNADTEHTSHLSEGQIAVQCNTSNCDVKWEVKAEHSVEPNTFSSLKFEPEADTFDFVTVKEEAKLEVMQEESEVLTESTLKRDGLAAPEKPTRVGNSVSAGNSAYHTQIYKGESNLQSEDTGECSQKCNTCGKLLPDLQSHVCKRNDDKRYKCDICGKCLANSSTLKAHLRIHTGEKPYICDVCGKCFSLSGTIRRHARLHTVLMDVVKTEPEVDPLALQSNDDSDTGEANHLSHQETLLQWRDPIYDLKKELKVEEYPERIPFGTVKCEPEEDTFDVLKVKEDTNLEIDEDYEVFTESLEFDQEDMAYVVAGSAFGRHLSAGAAHIQRSCRGFKGRTAGDWRSVAPLDRWRLLEWWNVLRHVLLVKDAGESGT
ncbi:hypothetical protein ANN_27616 [Periplaneta americana]|uniref:C2H2-type domain-containing protein n=1 Tax=Periplaneta americana TaxID=6978 RepID=A0ABQ8RWH5_PERAM|nr:hypothetical protein ANN_27616 [Periplaneta americana]